MDTVKGLKELVNKLKDVGDQVKDKEVDKVLMEAALEVKDQARQNAPVDTGTLRDSIVATYGKPKRSGVRDVVVVVKTNPDDGAPHAYIVEFGSSKQAAHAFLRPAVKQSKAKVLEILSIGLRDILKGTK